MSLYFTVASLLQPKQLLNALSVHTDELVAKIKHDTRANTQLNQTLDQYQDIDYTSL